MIVDKTIDGPLVNQNFYNPFLPNGIDPKNPFVPLKNIVEKECSEIT